MLLLLHCHTAHVYPAFNPCLIVSATSSRWIAGWEACERSGNQMSGQSDEYERSLAFSEIALGQIKALRQPAYPRNYEVWYAYATGYNPTLNQTINETITRHGT